MSAAPVDSAVRAPTPPEGLPRVLAGRRGDGPASLEEHLAHHGSLPRVGQGAKVRKAFVDMVERAGLRGRGGAGFPTAVKLRAVARGRRTPVVLANGAEGEPASRKDELLLADLPHLVLDGAMVAAEAVNASEVIVAVDRASRRVRTSVARALGERRAANVDRVPVRVVDAPSRYVAGEESALVHWVNGGDAKPTTVPPRPYQRGVHGRPTLVQNVETLANLALIARFGDEWFRSVGSPQEPGSALVTVGGAIARPGVCEVGLGTPISAVLEAAGGATEDITTFLVGGYIGSWLPASAATMGLGDDLRAAGATFGCGVLFALPATACGVVETARVARYLANETAGQCGPCVFGLAAIAGALEAVARGERTDTDRLRRWLHDVAGRGACHHPDGAVRFVASALQVFAADVERHLSGMGPCAGAHRPPVLPVPAPGARETGWR